MVTSIITCQDEGMSNENERDKDVAMLDSAAAGMSELANMELDASTVSSDDFRAYCRVRIEAAKALVPILERKAMLLGLDAQVGKNASPNGAGTLAELEQKLALAARAGGAGKSS